MSLVSSTAKITSGGFFDFPIEQSLRFDGSSYLSRTPTTASNQKTWTFSFWSKASIGSGSVFSAGANESNVYVDDALGFFIRNLNCNLLSSTKFRDKSAWYHFVAVLDLLSSPTARLYVNGALITSLQNSTYPNSSINPPVNSLTAHHIGNRTLDNLVFYNGYLANIQFIDGQALDPYFFGESKNGLWIPYNAFSTAGSGTAIASDSDTATDSYGTNGFHLTFEDGIETLSVNGSNVSAFRDKSHNTNHWKIN